jgi:voltage-gated potassium channel Kch
MQLGYNILNFVPPESFYYEIITFTTVGYGDIIPATPQGKLLAICTALLGATHGVTFVALVLQALTQHPPAKSQE